MTEKLKDEIKREAREKQTLLDQRTAKADRLEELEGKAKEFEVLGNVDLTKLLKLIEKKESRIKYLEQTSLDSTASLDNHLRTLNSKIAIARSETKQEASLKNEARDQLQEIKKKSMLLQAEDESIQANYWRNRCDQQQAILQQYRDDN